MTPQLQRLAFLALGFLAGILLFGCGGPDAEPVGHLPADPFTAPALACDAGCTDPRVIQNPGYKFTLADPPAPPPFPGPQL